VGEGLELGHLKLSLLHHPLLESTYPPTHPPTHSSPPHPPRYVIVDEGHAYRGAFGCHTALVLRRLRRVCERAHGATPLFVMTSATVANPHHHARQLLGLSADERMEVVTEDGSPSGPRLFALWNPPLTAEAKVSFDGVCWAGRLVCVRVCAHVCARMCVCVCVVQNKAEAVQIAAQQARRVSTLSAAALTRAALPHPSAAARRPRLLVSRLQRVRRGV